MGNRRDFFRKVGQFGCLSLLVGGTAYLAADNRIDLNGCGDNQFCRQCNKLESCALEPARNQRNNSGTVPDQKKQ
jgi:hypothetical protein